NNDDPSEEKLDKNDDVMGKEELGVDYFDRFLTRGEVAYHDYLMSAPNSIYDLCTLRLELAMKERKRGPGGVRTGEKMWGRTIEMKVTRLSTILLNSLEERRSLSSISMNNRLRRPLRRASIIREPLLRDCMGAALVALGPETFLKFLPLNVEAQDQRMAFPYPDTVRVLKMKSAKVPVFFFSFLVLFFEENEPATLQKLQLVILRSSAREILPTLSGIFIKSSKDDDGGSLQRTISEFASLANKTVVSRIFKSIAQKLPRRRTKYKIPKVPARWKSTSHLVKLHCRKRGLGTKEVDLVFVAIVPA
nr:hypothetical protein [Tanacetum cinerariifolium]